MNELRINARLNQVVCTLEGMTSLFQQTPGDFAVVIHGDRDCVNVLVTGMDHPGTERFFCSNLTADQAMAGKSVPRLEACLEAICQRIEPGIVFVLGTCLTTLVGDDPESRVGKLIEKHGVPIVVLSGGGMRFVSQSSSLDRFARLMLESCPPAASPEDRAVNLVGFHPGAEVLEQLAELGVVVNSILVPGSSLSEWRSLPAAGHNLLLDPFLYSGFAAQARDRLGQQSRQVAFPAGHRSTNLFFEQVLALVRPTVDPDSVLADSRSRAARAVEKGYGVTRGIKLGYNIGSKKNLDPVTLALEGLCDLPVFEQLGFQPVILVQGDDRPDRTRSVVQALSDLGCAHPLAIFSDTVFFGELCREQGCQMVYASDHLEPQARWAHAAFLEQGSLRAGYSQVGQNIERILLALRNQRVG